MGYFQAHLLLHPKRMPSYANVTNPMSALPVIDVNSRRHVRLAHPVNVNSGLIHSLSMGGKGPGQGAREGMHGGLVDEQICCKI